MELSHILVAGLTGISLALLIWIEIRSRRNRAAEEQSPISAGSQETPTQTKRQDLEGAAGDYLP